MGGRDRSGRDTGAGAWWTEAISGWRIHDRWSGGSPGGAFSFRWVGLDPSGTFRALQVEIGAIKPCRFRFGPSSLYSSSIRAWRSFAVRCAGNAGDDAGYVLAAVTICKDHNSVAARSAAELQANRSAARRSVSLIAHTRGAGFSPREAAAKRTRAGF